MHNLRNKTLAGAESLAIKSQYLREDSEAEESVRLGSMYLKSSQETEINRVYEQNS